MSVAKYASGFFLPAFCLRTSKTAALNRPVSREANVTKPLTATPDSLAFEELPCA